MHCDLKEENLMLRTDDYAHPQVVIIDFGIAHAFANTADLKLRGTPGYIPPETWRTSKWYPKGDCFSLAVVMLQLVTGCSRKGIFTTDTHSLRDVREATLTREPPIALVPSYCCDLAAVLQP